MDNKAREKERSIQDTALDETAVLNEEDSKLSADVDSESESKNAETNGSQLPAGEPNALENTVETLPDNSDIISDADNEEIDTEENTITKCEEETLPSPEEKYLSPDNIFSVTEESSEDTAVQEDEESEELPEDNYTEGEAEESEEDTSEGDSAQSEKNEILQYAILNLPTESTRKKEEESHSSVSAYDPKKPRNIDKVFDFVELFVFTLVAVMLISTFLFRHSIVDGPSMENTLHHGDHLIISNLFYTPKQGDIIVCDDHTTAIKKPIVKRVIAVAGQRVTITPDGVITVDGQELKEEDYVFIDERDYEYVPYDDVVPVGKIFVMGDHRNASSDSRLESVGPIDVDAVIGRVIFRIFPNFGTLND